MHQVYDVLKGVVCSAVWANRVAIGCCDASGRAVRLECVNLEGRRRLGGAVYRGDGREIVQLLTPEVTTELPQIAGQAALVALAQETPGADERARQIVTHLAERDWDGDDELRAELRCALGQDLDSPPPAVPVDLAHLVDLLQGGEHHSGGRLNVRTGEALPDLVYAEMADQFDEEDAVEDEWLYVDALGSQEAYRDMERFIADVAPPLISGSLTEAITGKGAFSRFRDRIAGWPDLAYAWRLYSEERWLGRARLWLAEAGYRPG